MFVSFVWKFGLDVESSINERVLIREFSVSVLINETRYENTQSLGIISPLSLYEFIPWNYFSVMYVVQMYTISLMLFINTSSDSCVQHLNPIIFLI